MSFMKHRYAILSGVAALCAVLAAGAQAAELSVETIRIRYVSSQLATPEGTQKLYSQIRHAAEIVCHMPDMRDIRMHPDYETCYNNAVNNAVAAVDAGNLTALHKQRTQRGAAG